MTEERADHIKRRELIAQLLAPCLDLGRLRAVRQAADDVTRLRCSWIDAATGEAAVDVFIDAVDDIAALLEDLRAQVRGADSYDQGSATELTGFDPGEYVFVRHAWHSVTALTGRCRVQVYPPDSYRDLATLAPCVLEIGRRIGCVSFDDGTPGTDTPQSGVHWGVGPGLPGIPPMMPSS